MCKKFVLITHRICFEIEPLSDLVWLELLIDIIILIDVFLKFITAFEVD